MFNCFVVWLFLKSAPWQFQALKLRKEILNAANTYLFGIILTKWKYIDSSFLLQDPRGRDYRILSSHGILFNIRCIQEKKFFAHNFSFFTIFVHTNSKILVKQSFLCDLAMWRNLSNQNALKLELIYFMKKA